MRARKALRCVAWVACLSGLLALALSFIVFAQSSQAQQQQRPPLQGGVSQTVPQQPPTDTSNSQGAASGYACFDAALCFQGLLDETQRAIEHAMSTKDPEWHKPESCARNPVWQNLNPSACWQYLTKARNLAEQNDSANSYSLQQQAQAALDQAHQCFDPIYRRWGELGGSYNDPNWNCGKGPAPSQPLIGQPNTRPTSSSVGSGASCGKWASAIVQSGPGGGPGSHGARPGTGGIVGPAEILCFWRDANGLPAVHPQIIPAPGFIKSSFDPPGAALKECGDKLRPGWIATGGLLCPPTSQGTGGGEGSGSGSSAGANPPEDKGYLMPGRYDVYEGTMAGGGSNRPDRPSGWATIGILGTNRYQLTLATGAQSVLQYYGIGTDGMRIYSTKGANNHILYIKFNKLQSPDLSASYVYYDVVWIGAATNSNKVETWQRQ